MHLVKKPPTSHDTDTTNDDDNNNNKKYGGYGLSLLEVPGMLMNHSCDPTANGALDIATLDLFVGDEITDNYLTHEVEQGFKFDCDCGASNCKSKYGYKTFFDLPPDKQKEFLPSISDFIRANYEYQQSNDKGEPRLPIKDIDILGGGHGSNSSTTTNSNTTASSAVDVDDNDDIATVLATLRLRERVVSSESKQAAMAAATEVGTNGTTSGGGSSSNNNSVKIIPRLVYPGPQTMSDAEIEIRRGSVHDDHKNQDTTANANTNNNNNADDDGGYALYAMKDFDVGELVYDYWVQDGQRLTTY